MITEETIVDLLGREQFRSWLEQLNEAGFMAGYTEDEETCPIANYLRESGPKGLQQVCVYDETVAWFRAMEDEDVTGTDLPAWARRFVQEVDEGDPGSPIWPTRALEILDMIETGGSGCAG